MSRCEGQTTSSGRKVHAASDGDGLLATSYVNAAQNLALPVELPLDAVFQLAGELQVIKDADLGLGRRERRALGRWASGGEFTVFTFIG